MLVLPIFPQAKTTQAAVKKCNPFKEDCTKVKYQPGPGKPKLPPSQGSGKKCNPFKEKCDASGTKPVPKQPFDPQRAAIELIKRELARRYSKTDLAVLRKRATQIAKANIRKVSGNVIRRAAQQILRKYPKSSFVISGTVQVVYDGSKRNSFEDVLSKFDIKFLGKSGNKNKTADAKKIVKAAITAQTAKDNSLIRPVVRALLPGKIVVAVPFSIQMKPSLIKMTTDKTFAQDVLKNSKPVLVEFEADWCNPCKLMQPRIVKLAKKYKGRLEVYELDVDINKQTAAKYKVDGLPTLLIFKGGRVVGRVKGLVSAARIEKELKKALGTGLRGAQ